MGDIFYANPFTAIAAGFYNLFSSATESPFSAVDPYYAANPQEAPQFGSSAPYSDAVMSGILAEAATGASAGQQQLPQPPPDQTALLPPIVPGGTAGGGSGPLPGDLQLTPSQQAAIGSGVLGSTYNLTKRQGRVVRGIEKRFGKKAAMDALEQALGKTGAGRVFKGTKSLHYLQKGLKFAGMHVNVPGLETATEILSGRWLPAILGGLSSGAGVLMGGVAGLASKAGATVQAAEAAAGGAGRGLIVAGERTVTSGGARVIGGWLGPLGWLGEAMYSSDIAPGTLYPVAKQFSGKKVPARDLPGVFRAGAAAHASTVIVPARKSSDAANALLNKLTKRSALGPGPPKPHRGINPKILSNVQTINAFIDKIKAARRGRTSATSPLAMLAPVAASVTGAAAMPFISPSIRSAGAGVASKQDKCSCKKKHGKARKCLERAPVVYKSGRYKGKTAGTKCLRYAS